MGTYWNCEPAKATRVMVRVGTSPRPTWWCASLAGSVRRAVLVEYGDQRHLLDDEDGTGWFKVTEGRGSPRWGHRDLPDDSQIVSAR